MTSNGNWTEWSTIQGESASSFKLAKCVEQGRFVSTITPELYDTKSNYQWY